jgi:hypothetical protein
MLSAKMGSFQDPQGPRSVFLLFFHQKEAVAGTTLQQGQRFSCPAAKTACHDDRWRTDRYSAHLIDWTAQFTERELPRWCWRRPRSGLGIIWPAAGTGKREAPMCFRGDSCRQSAMVCVSPRSCLARYLERRYRVAPREGYDGTDNISLLLSCGVHVRRRYNQGGKVGVTMKPAGVKAGKGTGRGRSWGIKAPSIHHSWNPFADPGSLSVRRGWSCSSSPPKSDRMGRMLLQSEMLTK